MSKINIFSLGGCQEVGKNLYVVEVDSHIYILDAGLKYPTSEFYGVDNIIPDISYLVEHEDKIQGLFLSHGHDDHIGAVYSLVSKIKNLKVYGSKFTLALVKEQLNDLLDSYEEENLIEVNSSTVLKFESANVRFFDTAHSIPDSLGIIIDTADGDIVYTSNFTFDQNQHNANFLKMYSSLVSASKNGVLALMCESLGTYNDAGRGIILEFKQRIQQIFTQSDKRIIFSLFSSDLLRIQQIIDISLQFGKKVAILGRKTQKAIDLGIKLGYLQIPEDKLANLRFIDDKNKNDDPNMVVLVAGERHEPYYMLSRMARGQDRLIHIEESDTVVILTTPYLGTEKMAAKTLDNIYHVTSKVITFNEKLLPQSNANREEIKELINILKPKYLLPVIGEYRHQYQMIQIATCVGFDSDDIIICDNGDMNSFVDKEYVGIIGSAPVGEILIDGDEIENVSKVVMRDRELLAGDGVIIIVSNINPRSREILTGPEIVDKGFPYIESNIELKTAIIESFKKIASKHFACKFVNWNDFKSDVREDVSRIIYKCTKSNPIVVPVLISTESKTLKDMIKFKKK